MMTETVGREWSSGTVLEPRLGPSCMSRTLADRARFALADAPGERPRPVVGGTARASQDVAEPAAPSEEGGMVESDLAAQGTAFLPRADVPAPLLDAVAGEGRRDTFADEPVL